MEENLAISNTFKCNADSIEILISKYENAKRQQEELQKEALLSNEVQHKLLEQNIHILNGIIEELRNLL